MMGMGSLRAPRLDVRQVPAARHGAEGRAALPARERRRRVLVVAVSLNLARAVLTLDLSCSCQESTKTGFPIPTRVAGPEAAETPAGGSPRRVGPAPDRSGAGRDRARRHSTHTPILYNNKISRAEIKFPRHVVVPNHPRHRRERVM